MRREKIFTPTSPRDPQLRTIPWGLIFRSLFLLGIVIGIVYFIFFSPYFLITKIEIRGPILVSQEEINSLVQAEIDQEPNIWFFSGDQLEEKVKKTFPLIEAATAQKGIPDTIRLLVREREPQLIWQTKKEEYLVDNQGYIFSRKKEYQEKAQEEKSYLPRIRDLNDLPISLNQKVAAKDWVDFIKQLDRLLIEEANLKVRSFTIKGTTFDLAAVTDRGQILFDTSRPAKEQVAYLKTAFENIKRKQFQYLDLRVKGWVYYQ